MRIDLGKYECYIARWDFNLPNKHVHSGLLLLPRKLVLQDILLVLQIIHVWHLCNTHSLHSLIIIVLRLSKSMKSSEKLSSF